jgi:hypothetical protein
MTRLGKKGKGRTDFEPQKSNLNMGNKKLPIHQPHNPPTSEQTNKQTNRESIKSIQRVALIGISFTHWI